MGWNEIKQEFLAYADRTKQIRSLSSPWLEEGTNAESYGMILAENFKRIGHLAEINRSMIQRIIEPLVCSTEPLDQETVDAVIALDEELMNASSLSAIDLAMADELAERLARDAGEKEDEYYSIQMLDKKIDDSYLMMTQIKRTATAGVLEDLYRQRGIRAFETLMDYLPEEKFAGLDPESRRCVLVNLRYGAVLFETLGVLPAKMARRRIEILDRALAVSEDEFYHRMVPEYDWRYHFFRIYEYYCKTDARMLDEGERLKIAEAADRLVELYCSDEPFFRQIRSFREVSGFRMIAYYQAGKISRREFQEQIYDLIRNRDPRDFSKEGFTTNLYFPVMYSRSLDFLHLSEQERRRVIDIYRASVAYVFNAPKQGMLVRILDSYIQLLLEFHELPGGPTFLEMCMSTMAAIHPPTYIHSRMVAQLARCLTQKALEIAPERFLGVQGCETVEQVAEHRDSILDYAYHAALCHDIGKIPMIDTIFIYGRSLMNVEFDMIRLHPSTGAAAMKKHASTREYADIAMGHHLWYDGSQGYPEQFDPKNSPHRVFIELTACADCMDAATDDVGRSYKKGKTFDEYIDEVREGAGTRYASWIADLLERPELREKLQELLEKKRREIYRDTFMLLKEVNDYGIDLVAMDMEDSEEMRISRKEADGLY